MSLLTGVLPSTSGIYELNQPHHHSPLLKKAYTLPAHFKVNGYQVVGRGKIYHGRYKYLEDWHDFKATGDARTRQFRIKVWHQVKLVRDTDKGTIEVYFDDMKKPHMKVVDKTFGRGRIGIGSFDDMNDFDDIKLRGR